MTTPAPASPPPADATWALWNPVVWESPDERSIPALLAGIGQLIANHLTPTPSKETATMPTIPPPNPVTKAVLDELGIRPEIVVDISPHEVTDDHVQIYLQVLMPRQDYDDIVEAHRPKTPAEELEALARIGGRRRDQSSAAELAWFEDHPLREVAMELDDLGRIASWLRERRA